MRLTTHHQLFGPLPGAGYSFTYPPAWMNLTAFTANAKEWYFNHEHPPIIWASWLIAWTPTSALQKARLTSHYWDGPMMSPMLPFAEVTAAPNGNPILQSVNITAHMQALRASGFSQQVVGGVFGANAPATIFESRIQILWDLSATASAASPPPPPPPSLLQPPLAPPPAVPPPPPPYGGGESNVP